MTHQSTLPIDSSAALGATIRERRRALKLTQGELAEMSGVDQANLSRIELGIAGATLDTFLRLCLPLGIDILAGVRR